MPYIGRQETLQAPSHYHQNFPRFAILSLEMLLLSYSCIEDHAYISRGEGAFHVEHCCGHILKRKKIHVQ